MVTYLSRLSLFILLTCSFNSFAKYSEAMCILYKQQMQQYSDNTSSRSYRNAARDYDKNCSNPPPVEKVQTPVTKPNNSLPEPVTTKAEQSSSQPIEQSTVAVNPLDSKVEQAKSSEKAVPTAVVEASEVSTTEVEATAEPIKEQVEPLNQQPINAPTPAITSEAINNDAETGSLLMPSLLLLAVLLLAGLLLQRLRGKKNSAAESIESNVVDPLASTLANKPSKAAVADEKKQSATQQPIAQQPTAENDLASTAPQPSPLDDDGSKQAQLTQRIFSNDHDFKEPEVRTFDPDALLPGQKPSVSSEVQTSDDSEQRVNSTEEVAPQTDSFKQDLESTADHTVGADSDDDLTKALAALNEELAAEQQPELESNKHEPSIDQDDTATAEQKANPFANLSLDPSWDPNSPEKPTIVPKKKVPKSAELIAAQERAKQLKTDD